MNKIAVALIAVAGFSFCNANAIAREIDFSSNNAAFALEQNGNPEPRQPPKPIQTGGSR